jgi:hypothetical protein
VHFLTREETTRIKRAAPIEPQLVPIQERVRRLPEAMLLTAGFYASRIPVIGDIVRRID